jgi:hypothetical protein
MTGVQPSSPVDVEIASKADQERVFGTMAAGPGLCNCEFPDKKKLPPATGSTGARLSSNCHVQRTTHRSAVTAQVALPPPCTIAIFEKVF